MTATTTVDPIRASYDQVVAAETDLLAVAEGIYQAQRIANANNATSWCGGVWGQLNEALIATLALYFREGDDGEATEQGARNAAKAVMEQVHDNGESIAYNVRIGVSHLYA